MIVMSVLRILFFSALLAINFPVVAQVYKSTDADGNVTYSDQPSADSEQVDVPEPNVGDAVKVPESAPAPAPAPEPAVAKEKKPDDLWDEQSSGDSDGRNRRPRVIHHYGQKHRRK